MKRENTHFNQIHTNLYNLKTLKKVFVIYLLEQFFNKSREDATRIMLHVHQHGVGVCGIFTYEVAETKVAQVVDTARRHQHPLQCTMEKD